MTNKIKNLHPIEKPLEKLLRYGAEKLSMVELLAVIFRTGIKNKGVLELAEEVSRIFDIKNLKSMSFEKLRSIKGIGKVKLGQVLALIEIAKRLNNSQEIYIQSPEDVFRLMSNYLNSKKEHFVAFYLNTRLSLIKQELISIGILNASMVHPREVFEPAIRYLASSIIVAHNHPSGSLEPSNADIEVSLKLRESGKILGIELVDHIIVSKNGWYSFKDNQVVFN